jgi:hypothetical protein
MTNVVPNEPYPRRKIPLTATASAEINGVIGLFPPDTTVSI